IAVTMRIAFDFFSLSVPWVTYDMQKSLIVSPLSSLSSPGHQVWCGGSLGGCAATGTDHVAASAARRGLIESSPSVCLDARALRALRPAPAVGLEDRADLLGRPRHDLDPALAEALAHLGRGEDLHDLGVQALHDLARRAGDGEDAEPHGDVVAGN